MSNWRPKWSRCYRAYVRLTKECGCKFPNGYSGLPTLDMIMRALGTPEGGPQAHMIDTALVCVHNQAARSDLVDRIRERWPSAFLPDLVRHFTPETLAEVRLTRVPGAGSASPLPEPESDSDYVPSSSESPSRKRTAGDSARSRKRARCLVSSSGSPGPYVPLPQGPIPLWVPDDSPRAASEVPRPPQRVPMPHALAMLSAQVELLAESLRVFSRDYTEK